MKPWMYNVIVTLMKDLMIWLMNRFTKILLFFKENFGHMLYKLFIVWRIRTTNISICHKFHLKINFFQRFPTDSHKYISNTLFIILIHIIQIANKINIIFIYIFQIQLQNDIYYFAFACMFRTSFKWFNIILLVCFKRISNENWYYLIYIFNEIETNKYIQSYNLCK